MAAALEIRRDLFSPVELRSRARRERNPRTAKRMLEITNVLEGLTRAEAAQLAGLERPALRDAVVRYTSHSQAQQENTGLHSVRCYVRCYERSEKLHEPRPLPWLSP